MKLYGIALCCVLAGETVLGVDEAATKATEEAGAVAASEKTEVSSHVTAKLSPVANAAGARIFYIYSKKPLISLGYRVGDSESWDSMNAEPDQNGYHVYSSRKRHPAEPGATFQIAGVTPKLVEIIDELVVGEDQSVAVSGVRERQLQRVPRLDQNTIQHGSSEIHPQLLAQARANEMARRGSMVHLGGGIVRTVSGRLAEGIGCGGPNCGTCTATNGTAAVGDGQAVGGNGMTYRCRLYDSPGTASGGGGRGRGRRR